MSPVSTYKAGLAVIAKAVGTKAVGAAAAAASYVVAKAILPTDDTFNQMPIPAAAAIALGGAAALGTAGGWTAGTLMKLTDRAIDNWAGQDPFFWKVRGQIE